MNDTQHWTVDPAASTVAFMVRGFWGLVPARGTLAIESGYASTVGGELVSGEIVIDAASVDTGLALRDRHLRGAHFFDAERHRQIVFSLMASKTTGDRLHGTAQIKATTMALDVPVAITNASARVEIHGRFDVDRRAAGLDHSPLGMVRGPAHIDAMITLRSAS
jgi:polyisoprenoid-binding protein YceI